MRALLVIVAGLIAGCDSPDLDNFGVPARHVTVEGSTFTVYVNGTQVEAIRTNPEIGAAARGIMDRGYRAIRLASGCDIVPGSYDGDPARMTAEIACVGASGDSR